MLVTTNFIIPNTEEITQTPQVSIRLIAQLISDIRSNHQKLLNSFNGATILTFVV